MERALDKLRDTDHSQGTHESCDRDPQSQPGYVGEGYEHDDEVSWAWRSAANGAATIYSSNHVRNRLAKLLVAS